MILRSDEFKVWAVLFAGLFFSTTAMAETAEELWQKAQSKYFDSRHIEVSEFMQIAGPRISENGSQVPLIITIDNDKTPSRIEKLYLILDGNPIPLAATYKLGGLLGNLKLETRIRMDKQSNIRIIGETAEGKLYMATTNVEAGGGCGGNVNVEDLALNPDFGRIRLNLSGVPGGNSHVAFMIKHPMLSGLQHNSKTKEKIPANYISKTVFRFNGELLFEADFGVSTSENPYLRFTFIPKQQGELGVIAEDNFGKKFSHDLKATF